VVGEVAVMAGGMSCRRAGRWLTEIIFVEVDWAEAHHDVHLADEEGVGLVKEHCRTLRFCSVMYEVGERGRRS
jgi:hypothetical protein